MGLTETVWEGVDWIHVAEDRGKWRAFLNMVMSLRAASNAGNFLVGFVTVNFAIRSVFRGVDLLPNYRFLVGS
jgi:hypothetical protein